MADININRDLEHDYCICGRHAWRAHCPHCGSYHNYSYINKDKVRRDDGSIAQLTVYRCRRCASTFNDDEWKNHCAAPHVSLASKRGRPLVDDTPTKFESLEEVPEEQRRALDAVLEARNKGKRLS